MQKKIETSLRLAGGEVVQLGFANWVAPSVFSAKDLEVQHSLLSAIVNMSEKGIAFAVMPLFTYKKGSLYQLENAQLESLSKRCVNVDKTFSLLYVDKKTHGTPAH